MKHPITRALVGLSSLMIAAASRETSEQHLADLSVSDDTSVQNSVVSVQDERNLNPTMVMTNVPQHYPYNNIMPWNGINTNIPISPQPQPQPVPVMPSPMPPASNNLQPIILQQGQGSSAYGLPPGQPTYLGSYATPYNSGNPVTYLSQPAPPPMQILRSPNRNTVTPLRAPHVPSGINNLMHNGSNNNNAAVAPIPQEPIRIFQRNGVNSNNNPGTIFTQPINNSTNVNNNNEPVRVFNRPNLPDAGTVIGNNVPPTVNAPRVLNDTVIYLGNENAGTVLPNAIPSGSNVVINGMTTSESNAIRQFYGVGSSDATQIETAATNALVQRLRQATPQPLPTAQTQATTAARAESTPAANANAQQNGYVDLVPINEQSH